MKQSAHRHIREALSADIPQMQIVRNSVKENMLSDPALVSDADCEEFIHVRGKGWVCEIDGRIVGFAIVDWKENNIWALFVHPEFEGQGIGKALHRLMLDGYFKKTQTTVWLGTAPHTRAETFYAKQGWTRTGTVHKNETKFEMAAADWASLATPG